MSLATTDGFNLWSTGVNFVSDEYLNIYFISGKQTTHVKNIIDNHIVSLTIFDSHQNSLEERVGLQARGFCGKVGILKTESILLRWNAKFSERTLSIEDLEKNDVSIYKIILTRIKFLNTGSVEKVIELDL